jgi:hypothetical protein
MTPTELTIAFPNGYVLHAVRVKGIDEQRPDVEMLDINWRRPKQTHEQYLRLDVSEAPAILRAIAAFTEVQ